MSEKLKKEALSEDELKELRRRRRILKKKRMEKKKARKEMHIRALIDDDEAVVAEAPEVRQERLYAKAQKKLRFAPHMYRREDKADMYRQAAELFGETAGYENADMLREECLREAEEHRKLYIEETYALVEEQLARAKTLGDCQKIRENLTAIADFKDVGAFQTKCEQLEQQLLKRQKNKKVLKYFLAGVVILLVLFVIFYMQGIVRIGIKM